MEVSYYVYQSSAGGQTYSPLLSSSQLIGNATPRLSQMLAWKYAHMSGESVVNDMNMNHLVKFSKGFIQKNVDQVGELFASKGHNWTYSLEAEIGEEVSHIGISRDGAHMPVCPSGWREAMCGSISFYDSRGNRLHTIYKACAPEHGTATFQSLMDFEVETVKKRYPKAIYLGLADGAKPNWVQLSRYTAILILDFFHASEYIHEAAKILFSTDKKEQAIWAKKNCHALKNIPKGANKILAALKKAKKALTTPQEKDALQVIITYFSNHLAQMDYATFIEKGYPIGSGVIEAACKTVVKQRFSASGMKWTIPKADHLLLVRALALTKGRWKTAWQNFNKSAA